MTVTRDATSGFFFPANATEATSWLAGLGIGAPFALYQLQEASGAFVDSISGINLANTGFSYQGAITGWTRLAAHAADGAGSFFDNLSSSWPDLHTTSQTVVFLFEIANTPGGKRTVLALGGLGAGNLFVNYDTSDFFEITDQTNTGTGSTNHGTGVLAGVLRYNLTATTADLFVGAFTALEKISKTFTTPASGAHGLGVGAFEFDTPTIGLLGIIAFDSAAAEMTDAQVAALANRIVTGYVASIALTPNPVSLVSGTQQLVATATMGDGSTYVATSDPNASWSSSNPGIATVSSTGLVTAVASGTTTITCTYGGVTSAGDVVTVGLTPSTFVPPTLIDPVPGNIGLINDGAIIDVDFSQPAGTYPRDKTGDLNDLGSDSDTNAPTSIACWSGDGRRFRQGSSNACYTTDDVVGSTLELRDVTVQAIIAPTFAGASGTQTIIQRGNHDGTAGEPIAYGLQFSSPSTGQVLVEWFWEDASGTIHVDAGGAYVHPGDDEFVLLTATRRWDSTSSVTCRYYAGDVLLAENVNVNGSIAGGTTGHTCIGGSKQSGSWSNFLNADLDSLMVVPYEMCVDEIRATWQRLSIHQPNGVAMFAGLIPPGARWYRNPGNQIAGMVKTGGELVGYAVAKAEELRANFLPDQAYRDVIARWENVLQIASKPRDSLDTRRTRVIAFLSRLRGYSIPAIQQILSGPLDLDPGDVEILQYSNLIADSLSAAVSKPERWQQRSGVSGSAVWTSGSGVSTIAVASSTVAGSWPDAPASLTTEIPRSSLRASGYGPGAVIAQVELTAISGLPGSGDTNVTGLFLCDGVSNDAIWFGVADESGTAQLGYQVYSSHAMGSFVPIVAVPSRPMWLRVRPTTLQDQSFEPILGYSTTSATTGFTEASPGVSISAPTRAGIGSVGSTGSLAFSTSFANFAMLAYDGDRPYSWFAFRDPSLGGSPDITTARLALQSAKPAHTRSGVCQNTSVLWDDTRDGLWDCGPMGGL